MFENILKAFVIASLTPKQIEHHCFASVGSEQLKSKGMNPWTLSYSNIDEQEMTSSSASALPHIFIPELEICLTQTFYRVCLWMRDYQHLGFKLK